MEPSNHHSFVTSPVSDAQLRTIYASDQEMYPAPLSFDRLRIWVDACPDFSIAFYENEDATTESEAVASGVIIVLPLLRTYWEDLLVGTVKEIDIDPVMFPPTGREGHGDGVEVGLHVFHVERFRGLSPGAASSTSDVHGGKTQDVGNTIVTRKKGFAEVAVDEAVRRVGRKCGSGAETGRWRICGLSALTATEAGRKTFGRMGFVPTGYKEMFVTTRDGEGEATKLEMVCVYPPGSRKGDVDLPSSCNDIGSEPSEMVVKYL